MNQVQTTKGMIDRELLVAQDVVEEGDNYRALATEWRLINDWTGPKGEVAVAGELVRRDAAVSILRGHALAGEQAEL